MLLLRCMMEKKKSSFFLLIYSHHGHTLPRGREEGYHSLAHQPRVRQEERVLWQGEDTLWGVERGSSWGSATPQWCQRWVAVSWARLTAIPHSLAPSSLRSLSSIISLPISRTVKLNRNTIYFPLTPIFFHSVFFSTLCREHEVGHTVMSSTVAALSFSVDHYFAISNFLSLLQFWNLCQGYWINHNTVLSQKKDPSYRGMLFVSGFPSFWPAYIIFLSSMSIISELPVCKLLKLNIRLSHFLFMWETNSTVHCCLEEPHTGFKICMCGL